MNLKDCFCLLMGMPLLLAMLSGSMARAVSPDSITAGHQLFEHEWTSGNPSITSDGLGPLFNGASCVTCHHQGGAGGGGDARFNAHTVGIEQMEITGGHVDQAVIRRMVSQFHPGFVQPGGRVLNVMAVSHHGGSSQFAKSRDEMQEAVPIEFSPKGGPLDASEVRYGTNHSIYFSTKLGRYRIKLRARMYGRNTTALFGSGEIDKIKVSELEKLVKMQKKHPEISGRLSTLSTGQVGKFGWRANKATLLEFTDQASANEIGLETKQSSQASDPTMPAYRNTGSDISNQQLVALRDFVASLPAPQRSPAKDSKDRLVIERGQAVFSQAGCAVCHVPNVGSANGIYSDLLLHDMGPHSKDLNHAEPYIRKRSIVKNRYIDQETTSTTGSGTFMTGGGYYGPAAEIVPRRVEQISTVRSRDRSRSGGRSFPGKPLVFHFEAPEYPSETLVIADQASKRERKKSQRALSDAELQRRFRAVDANAIEEKETIYRTDVFLRLHVEPTRFNQEWRTPPLWGVADSAPYMHDGRAETLLEAIAMHDGEAAGSRDRFLNLSVSDRRAMLRFLETSKTPQANPQLANTLKRKRTRN